jgi:hypothetical protein
MMLSHTGSKLPVDGTFLRIATILDRLKPVQRGRMVRFIPFVRDGDHKESWIYVKLYAKGFKIPCIKDLTIKRLILFIRSFIACRTWYRRLSWSGSGGRRSCNRTCPRSSG